MSISSAQPIQFWPASQQTYNEKEVCGITPVCWCQPFINTDTVYVVAPSEAEESLSEFSIYVFDEDDEIVDSFEFSSSSQQIDLSSLNGFYYLKILDESNVLRIGNPNSAEWSEVGGSASHSVGSNYFEIVDAGTFAWEKVAVIPNRPTYEIHATITVTKNDPGGSVSGCFAAFVPEAGGLTGDILNPTPEYTFSAEGVYPVIFQLRPSASFVGPQQHLRVLMGSGSSVDVTVRMTIDPLEVFYIPEDAYTYKSDCLDIKESHPCTNLITYSNASDFAGLPYDNASPSPTFSVRVPSLAFHESFPREDEVQPLSNDTFRKLSSMITRKVEAEFGFMPYYMHQKLNLVFMHDFIEIDGTEYVLRDPYEIVDGRKSYPLKKATTLLTDKNFIERNLL